MTEPPARHKIFYGRRSQALLFAAVSLGGVYFALASDRIVPVVYQAALSVWLAVTAWRWWRSPILSDLEVQRMEQRRLRWGARPGRSAMWGWMWISLWWFAISWESTSDHVIFRLAVSAIAGGLIGIGLYAVFRTDPAYKPVQEQSE